MSKSYLIASGKGGVGKSTIAASLGQALSRRGYRVVILDADTGLRCLDLMLGLENKVFFDFADVCERRCMLQDALYPVPGYANLYLLSASQITQAAQIHPRDVKKVTQSLARTFDVVLMDCPAGVGRGLKINLGSVEEYILVTTPDDIAIRDAERTCQVMGERGIWHPQLVLNRIDRDMIRRGEMVSPRQIAQTLDTPLLGAVPESPLVYRGLLRRKTAYECGDKKLRQAIEAIADRLTGADTPAEDEHVSPVAQFFLRARD